MNSVTMKNISSFASLFDNIRFLFVKRDFKGVDVV